MAITLVTGLPGHGKTLYAISKYKEISEKTGRRIYYHGIKGLKLPWTEHDALKWADIPPNSIMIIDEAQKVFPLRGRGEPAAFIADLATHRHLGIDIVLITQDPMLIDSFARRLVDQHFHVVRKFGTHFVTIHEFVNGAKDNVSKSRSGSLRHEWRHDKKAFEFYHSAEVHTVKARLPARVYLLICLPFLVGGLLWFGYQRLSPSGQAAQFQKNLGASGIAPGVAAGVSGGGVGGGGVRDVSRAAASTGEFLAVNNPRVEGLAHTAPIYDDITRPVVAPFPAACVESKTRCQCYSQQATKLDMPAALCRQIVVGGFFVAWDSAGRAVKSMDQTAEVRQTTASGVVDPPPEQPSFVPVKVTGVGGIRNRAPQ